MPTEPEVQLHTRQMPFDCRENNWCEVGLPSWRALSQLVRNCTSSSRKNLSAQTLLIIMNKFIYSIYLFINSRFRFSSINWLVVPILVYLNRFINIAHCTTFGFFFTLFYSQMWTSALNMRPLPSIWMNKTECIPAHIKQHRPILANVGKQIHISFQSNRTECALEFVQNCTDVGGLFSLFSLFLFKIYIRFSPISLCICNFLINDKKKEKKILSHTNTIEFIYK